MTATLIESTTSVEVMRVQSSLLEADVHDAWLNLCGCLPDDDERTRAVVELLHDGVDPRTPDGRATLLAAEFPELAELPNEMPDDAIIDTSDRYSVFGKTHLRMLRIVTDELSSADLSGFGTTARMLARLGLRRREILHDLASIIDDHFRSTDSLRSVGVADPADVANRLRWLPPTVAASEFGWDELMARAVGLGDHDCVERLVTLHAEYLSAVPEDERSGTQIDRSDPYAHAASAYAFEGDHEHALTMAGRAVEAAPGGTCEHRRVRVLVGELLLAAGRADDAALQFQDVAAEADTFDLQVHVDIADACLDQRAPEAAFAWLDRGLDLALDAGVATLTSEQRSSLSMLLDLRADALPWDADDHRGDHARRLLRRIADNQPFASISPWGRNAPLRGHVTVEQPGRNDPCTCGSGKKFKRCCLS